MEMRRACLLKAQREFHHFSDQHPKMLFLLVVLLGTSQSVARAPPSNKTAAAALPALGCDPAEVSVSGLSAGAFMAVQLHVALSSRFTRGAGAIAGGPYYCAGTGGLLTAQTACMTTPALVDVAALVAVARATEKTGTIDRLANLAHARAYVFSGANDSVVAPGVVRKLEQFYGAFLLDEGAVAAEYVCPRARSRLVLRLAAVLTTNSSNRVHSSLLYLLSNNQVRRARRAQRRHEQRLRLAVRLPG